MKLYKHWAITSSLLLFMTLSSSLAISSNQQEATIIHHADGSTSWVTTHRDGTHTVKNNENGKHREIEVSHEFSHKQVVHQYSDVEDAIKPIVLANSTSRNKVAISKKDMPNLKCGDDHHQLLKYATQELKMVCGQSSEENSVECKNSNNLKMIIQCN